MLAEKKRFIIYELGLLTMKAAFSTRDNRYPIYNIEIKDQHKKPAKELFRQVLNEVETIYVESISSKDHDQYIEDTANRLSDEIGEDYLHNGRFRVGVAQKLINMHLKYLWCAGIINEPPHCPIDGRIRDIVKQDYPAFDYDWISNDSIDEYKNALETINQLAINKGETYAQWELGVFRRRDDEI